MQGFSAEAFNEENNFLNNEGSFPEEDLINMGLVLDQNKGLETEREKGV